MTNQLQSNLEGDVGRNYIAPSFSGIYRDLNLVDTIDKLSARYPYREDVWRYRNLVNINGNRTRPYHRWSRYREGYSADLVKDLIKGSGISPDKHFIIDPMCGSGTTLLASKEMGFDSLGADVNPFAVDLTRSKTSNYLIQDISSVKRFLSMPPSNQPSQEPMWSGMNDCRPYFNDNNFSALLRIRRAIEELPDEEAKRLLIMAWLIILEPCSNRKKDGNGLSSVETKIKDVWALYTQTASMMLQDIERHPLPRDTVSRALRSSAINIIVHSTEFQKERSKVPGAIIFSPPYANSFDYFETYKMELLFGGYCDMKGLASLKASAIRNYRISYGYELQSENALVNMLCEEIKKAIPEKEAMSGKVDARTRLVPNILKGYFSDMEVVIEAFSRMLPEHAWCHIVVDQSAYVGVVIPTDLLLADIAERKGFEVRQIIKCKKANTSTQQLQRFPQIKPILRSSIVSLQKSKGC